MNNFYFVFDVESIGLYGEAFAVAGGIYTTSGAIPETEFCFSIDRKKAYGSPDDEAWVNTYIPDIDITHNSFEEMAHAFWEECMKARKLEILIAAECLYPVEAKFLHRVINLDLIQRAWRGPYPFVEISTYLSAAGMDPMKDYPRLPSEEPKHHPLGDARQSARLLFEAIFKLELNKINSDSFIESTLAMKDYKP